MSILWPALGVGCLIVAIVLAWTAKELEVGENLARLLALLLACFGYWYVTSEIHVFSFTVHLTAFKWAVPIVLGVCVFVSVVKIFTNWKDESKRVVKGSSRMLAVVILCAVARFCLSR
ncbi:MAG: hypothetical protein WBE86_10150 [Candidatus Acidiferrales bacterium]